MKITPVILIFGLLFSAGFSLATFAGENHPGTPGMKNHNMMSNIEDERISLALSPQMKTNQLSNMRSHVEAIQTIIGLIGEGDFIKASGVAHAKLGLTEEMRRMCNMFDNEDFVQLGLAFHKSADALGDVLQTEDMNKSLRALHTTMGYCVQCHATFRQ